MTGMTGMPGVAADGVAADGAAANVAAANVAEKRVRELEKEREEEQARWALREDTSRQHLVSLSRCMRP
jgi:hypothetical protein